jgi:hypothetical protein
MASYQNPPKSEWENHIIISVQKKFDLKTGKEIDLLD